MILAPVISPLRPTASARFNAVILSGAGSSEADGTYAKIADVNGRVAFQKGSGLEAFVVQWSGGAWEIKKGPAFWYEDFDQLDVLYPWLVVTWDGLTALPPGPTVTPTRI